VTVETLVVREAADHGATKVGALRRGAVVAVVGDAEGEDCRGGWLEINGAGFVCGSYVERVDAAPASSPFEPFVAGKLAPYGRVKGRGATVCQAPQGLGAEVGPGCAPLPFGALVRLERALEPRGWAWKTIRSQYVLASRIETKQPLLPSLGIGLDERGLEGLAFARGPVPLWSEADHRSEPLRRLERFERVRIVETSGPFVQLEGGGWTHAYALRQARARPAPDGLADGERWIAVDLPEQVLVAYEGELPVYATLVSSGRNRSTPPGEYRIIKKSLSDDMSDANRRNSYLVEDVPFVMSYEPNRAIHGAFWHDEFGRVRSHGCVNVSIDDAAHLFEFASPSLPTGWHAIFDTPERPASRVIVYE